jgi:hypothetical protein
MAGDQGRETGAVDHDDFGSNRSKIMNVIDSHSLEHDVVRKPLRTFRHHALVRRVAAFCAVATGLMLAACGSSSTSFPQTSVVGEANVFPPNWRSDIVAYLRNYLNDPTGVRGAFISEPSIKQLVQVQRYASCVRYNAKKSTGEYEGSKDRVVVFLAGKLDTMVLARGDQCSGVTWQPFPEIEKLKR